MGKKSKVEGVKTKFSTNKTSHGRAIQVHGRTVKKRACPCAMAVISPSALGNYTRLWLEYGTPVPFRHARVLG